MNTNKRALVFIDGNAFKHFLGSVDRAITPETFDFARFCDWLVHEHGAGAEELIRGYLYAAAPVEEFGSTDEEKKTTAELIERKKQLFRRVDESDRMSVQLGHTQLLFIAGQPTFHEKGVDVKMASDITRYTFIGDYSVFYVITADNDIGYCMATAREMGKTVKWVNIAVGGSLERIILARECDLQIRLKPAEIRQFQIVSAPKAESAEQSKSKPARRRRR